MRRTLPKSLSILLRCVLLLTVGGTVLSTLHVAAHAALQQVGVHQTQVKPGLATTTDPVLFIHGISNTSSMDCNTWTNTTNFLQFPKSIDGQIIRWSGPMVKLAYYTADINCGDDNNPSTPYQLYNQKNNCTGYYDKVIGTNNEAIEHLGCELAWYIYTYYTSNSQNIELVGYSMGGLISRWAMAQSKPNNPPFPPTKLLVRDAVEMDSPNGGFKIGNDLACGQVGKLCVEGKEMKPGSPFLNALAQQAQNPQGATGTRWTLIGSNCGSTCADQAHGVSPQGGLCLDIKPQSAVDMNGARKIVYDTPCYDHQGLPSPFTFTMLDDTTDNLDATVLYCIACSYPKQSLTAYPHAIFAVFYTLTEAYIMTEYPLPNANTNPFLIAQGSDGNLWFTEANLNKIGRITPNGTISQFSPPTKQSGVGGITDGPDGNIWFTESAGSNGDNSGAIGRVTPKGSFAEFPLPKNASPGNITAGPDGNLWIIENDRIGRMTPGGILTGEFPIPTQNSTPVAITTGPDGNLWFTEDTGNNIGRITPGGSITEFPLPNGGTPAGITAGPDGNLWFTEVYGNNIGRITPGGVVTEFPIPTPNSQPYFITTGLDGSFWFTEFAANQIGHITPNGIVSEEIPIPTPNSLPYGITTASDGSIWFTEYNNYPPGDGNKIGRIVS